MGTACATSSTTTTGITGARSRTDSGVLDNAHLQAVLDGVP